MCAFVYGLNDSDERVRAEAAQQIASQLKRHPCCCNDKVAQALMCALGDCDKKVRKLAEKGLCLCGYEVANSCNSLCSATSCGAGNGCGAKACGPAAAGCGPAASVNCGPAPAGVVPAPAPAAAPAAPAEAAPAPAPPAAEPEAYFPARIRDQQTSRTRTLGNLFGLR